MWNNLTSLTTTPVANNFLQVIYSLKTEYSYDVTGNYLNYYHLNTFTEFVSVDHN